MGIPVIPSCIEAQIAFIAIRAYAAHSYLYYERDENIIADHEYDRLCKWLLENYEWVKAHDINKYLDAGALEAGTGHQLKVVGQTKKYADDLLEDHKKKKAMPDPFS